MSSKWKDTNYYSMNNDYDLIPEVDLNKYEELEVTLEVPVDGFGPFGEENTSRKRNTPQI